MRGGTGLSEAFARRREAVRAGFDARRGDWRTRHTVVYGCRGWFPHIRGDGLWFPCLPHGPVYGDMACAWARFRLDAPANALPEVDDLMWLTPDGSASA